MKKEQIEELLLSELAEVKGGQASQDCHCESGAAETIIIEVPEEPIEPEEPEEPWVPTNC